MAVAGGGRDRLGSGRRAPPLTPCDTLPYQATTEARKLRGSEHGEVGMYGLDGDYLFSDTAPWLDD